MARAVVAPLVLAERAPASLSRAVEMARADGWTVVEDWPARGSDPVVVRADVRDDRDAASAVLAALDGHGLLLQASAPRPVLDRLCDDLRRLGPLSHLVGDPPDPPPDPPHPDTGDPLTSTDSALLDLLRDGATVESAAAALNLSRRTVDRRLARIRSVMGVRTTVEAIVRHRAR